MIKTISYNQDEQLNDIYTLYNNGKVPECDITYSKGIFYKNGEKPFFKYDKFPITDEVRPLEEFYGKDMTFNSIMCDPPFVVSYGKQGNIIRNRFSGYKSIDELKSSYTELLNESYKHLNKDGILIFKCQDCKLHTQHQFWTHVYVMNEAEKIGFEIMDIFILLAKHRLPIKGNKQHSARKYHSYFIVLKKK